MTTDMREYQVGTRMVLAVLAGWSELASATTWGAENCTI